MDIHIIGLRSATRTFHELILNSLNSDNLLPFSSKMRRDVVCTLSGRLFATSTSFRNENKERVKDACYMYIMASGCQKVTGSLYMIDCDMSKKPQNFNPI